MAERRGNDLRGEKSQQLFFQVNSSSADQCQWKSQRSISVRVFQFVRETLQVLGSAKVQRWSSVKTGIPVSIRLLLYTDAFADSTAAVWLLRKQPLTVCRWRWFFFKGHLVAELRMTTIRQEQLSRGLQSIGFPEFLTLVVCQEWQRSTSNLQHADLISPLM